LVSGVIQILASPGLDYELESYYDVTVIVYDAYTPAVNATLYVTVLDVNEHPVFINLPDAGSVLENVTDAQTLTICNVTDPDGDIVTYNATISPSDGKLYFNDSSKCHFEQC
jgi:hypothetical protein